MKSTSATLHIWFIMKTATVKKIRKKPGIKSLTNNFEALNFIDEGLVILDKNFHVVFINNKICAGLGTEPEKLIGHNFFDFFPNLADSQTVAELKEAIKSKINFSRIDYYQPLSTWFECLSCPSDNETTLIFKKVSSPIESDAQKLNLENRSRILLDKSEDIIVFSGIDGKILSVNRAFELATGYKAEEVVGRHRNELLHPDDKEKSVKIFNELLKIPGQSVLKSTRIIPKKNETVWLKGKLSNLLHEPGFNAFVSNFHDITSLKKTEAILVSNENLYHKLFEHLLYGFVYAKVIRDEAGKVIDFEYVSANKAYEELVQFKNVIGKRISDLRKDFFVQQPEFMPGVIKVMETGLTHTQEFFVARIQKWLSLTFYSAEPEYFGCIVDDITEHKTLYEKQRYIASIVNSSEDAIISKDLSGKILSWNKSAEKLYGYLEEDAKQMHISQLIPEERKAEADLILSQIKLGQHIKQLETQRLTKHNELIDVSLTISPMHNSEGEINGASIISRDIRENLRQKKQEALLASIINYTQDAILSRDLNGIVTSWNKAAEKLFGYTEKEAVGMEARKLFPSHLLNELNVVDDLLKKGIPVKYFETERLNKSGKRIYVAIVVSPLYNDGVITGASIIARDITEKKLFENKLKESENNLNIIFENSTDMFLLVDRNLIVKAFNSKMRECALMKFGTNALSVGKSIFEFTDKKMQRMIKHDMTAALNGETIIDEVDFYQDGTDPHWYRAINSPVYENGVITGVCVAINDITVAKLAELKLKRSEENLKAVFNNSTQGFVLLNKNFEIQLFNANAEMFTYYSSHKHLVVGESILSVVNENQHPLILQHMHDVIENNMISGVELHSSLENNMYLEITLSPVYSDQEITGICVNINNITEKKIIEQERVFDQNNLESLINNTSDMMWSIDKNFQLVTYNKPFEHHMKNVMGIEMSKGVSLIEKGKNNPVINRFIKNLNRALKGESFTEVEPVPFTKDLWIESSFYPTYQNGEVIGTACFVRNISELKKRESEKEIFIKELTQSNADLRQFAYITSHNLRGPIANLLGLTNLLGNYPVKNPTLVQILDGIKKAAQRFDVTVKDLTQILTIKDNVSVPSENLKFENSLKLAIEQCEDVVKESKANIHSDFNACPEVHFNKSYLDSILMNLLTNAIKYRDFSRPLQIDVETSVEKEFIVLKFKDNGIGFDANANQGKLFKLYQRFHTEREGKGMGLFLIRSQLETLGGQVSVESKINSGTTFILKFKK